MKKRRVDATLILLGSVTQPREHLYASIPRMKAPASGTFSMALPSDRVTVLNAVYIQCNDTSSDVGTR
jgi:hypothetical protein